MKENELIVEHEYLGGRGVRVEYGVLRRRKILKIHPNGLITYYEIKRIKNGVKAIMRTISAKAFCKWAIKDVSSKE